MAVANTRGTFDFSDLVATIYDAALDASQWRGTLASLAGFVGGSSAALYSKELATGGGEFYFDSGFIDAQARRLYCERYAFLDPTTSCHLFAPIDEPMATDELVPYGEFVESRFYREWADPQRVAYGVSAVLEKAGSRAAIFGVFQPENDGPVGADMRCRMRLLAPHLRRATLVGRTVGLCEERSASLAEAMDRMSAGVFPVAENGALLHANDAGRSMAARGDMLRISRGELVLDDSEARARLLESVVAARRGDAALGGRGVSLSMKGQGGEPYVAHVLPMRGGSRREVGGSRTACAVFVRRAVVEPPCEPALLARTYGLTPTELRVLLAIVEVGGVPEVAEALGVAETTVKTHLARLFGKTGTSRQAELVKLVAGFASPVLN